MAALRLMSTRKPQATYAGGRPDECPHARDVAAQGTGPAFVRIGGRVRYRPSAVRQWLTGDRGAAGTAA